jgi:hypothetical protein
LAAAVVFARLCEYRLVKQVDENTPSAPLIIASPKVEPALMRKLMSCRRQDKDIYMFHF